MPTMCRSMCDALLPRVAATETHAMSAEFRLPAACRVRRFFEYLAVCSSRQRIFSPCRRRKQNRGPIKRQRLRSTTCASHDGPWSRVVHTYTASFICLHLHTDRFLSMYAFSMVLLPPKPLLPCSAFIPTDYSNRVPPA